MSRFRQSYNLYENGSNFFFHFLKAYYQIVLLNQISFQASENKMLDDSRKWLIMTEHENKIFNSTKTTIKDVFMMLNKLDINVDSDITYAVKKGRGTYRLSEVYNLGKTQGGDLIINNAGMWDSSKGFQTNLNEYKYYRRWNFHQWRMRVINVVSPAPLNFDPRWLTDLNPTPGVATITKTAITILTVIAEIHNIKYVILLC
ncbi:hypothetical protein ACJJTC_008682 [Scirpophaga incertulas]